MSIVLTETITLTRTFGMVPASRNDIVGPAELDRVVMAANAFIKAGATLDPSLLKGTTLVTVKRFYTAARKVPWRDPFLRATRLRERAWRCASHVAYFALQEHQRRCTVIPAIASAMQGMSLVQIHDTSFPSRAFLDHVRGALETKDVPAGCLSTAYLSNMTRHAKHLVESTLGSKYRNEIARCMASIAIGPGAIADAVARELHGDLEGLPAGIARAMSVRLTRRVKDRARGRGAAPGKHRLDPLVDAIRGGKDVAGWQQARRHWRDALVTKLSSLVRALDIGSIACQATNDVLATMTVDEAIKAMFKPRVRPRITVPGPVVPDPRRVLHERAMVMTRNHVGAALWAHLSPAILNVLGSLSNEPATRVSLPRCRKQCIPVAIDDGQVYRLDMNVDGETGNVTSAMVRFSLEPSVVRTFSLRGLDRMDAMLSRGFAPARGTITRKPGGGLLLHLPFEKKFDIAPCPRACLGSDGTPAALVACGVDLGLKHLAWLSVGTCHAQASTGGSWGPVDGNHPELARYCIDQPQLVGQKDEWLERTTPSRVPNVKRKLIALVSRARALQHQKALLKQRYGTRYKHSTRYFVARREWQRCWQKVRHLHEEITRQVATRIVAACKHHGALVLRFEDLSWSSHSARRVSGSWLASWQVHWFFSQVQERATCLARLAGIAVELVDARGTSKRCSTCGAIGNREGKTFSCTNEACNKQMDSDLNGARNVRIAPASLRLQAKREGARYRPLACHV